MELKCQNKRCNYEWNYKGHQPVYACCPMCRYKVRVIPTLKEQEEIKQLEEQLRVLKSREELEGGIP